MVQHEKTGETCDAAASCWALFQTVEARRGQCLKQFTGEECWYLHEDAARVMNLYLPLKHAEDERVAAEARAAIEAKHKELDALPHEPNAVDLIKTQKAEIEAELDARDAEAAAKHDQLVEYFRLMAPAARLARLHECYLGLRTGHSLTCRDVLQMCLDTAATEDEKKHIVAFNESEVRNPAYRSNGAELTGKTAR